MCSTVSMTVRLGGAWPAIMASLAGVYLVSMSHTPVILLTSRSGHCASALSRARATAGIVILTECRPIVNRISACRKFLGSTYSMQNFKLILAFAPDAQ